MINRQGLDGRTVELVERSLNEYDPNWQSEDCSATRIALELLEWIKQSSSKLKPGERAWLSTEILESLFGKYKQVECQHSKGGFTRLIAAIPTFCVEATKEGLRKAFQAVDCKATQKWIKTSLGRTLTTRKNAAYQESRPKKQVQLSAPA